MNSKKCALFAAIFIVLSLANHAHATYIALGVRLHTTVAIEGQMRDVYRIYALFNHPQDYLTAVAGSDVVGNMVIQNRNAADTGPGSGFVNPPGGGNTVPTDATLNMFPDARWDTFATIGVDVNYGGDYGVGISPGFPNFITGAELVSNSVAWFHPPSVTGQAGGPFGLVQALWFNGPSAVPGSRNAMGVLMMQLTVNAGEHVRGMVAVSGNNHTPPMGGQSFTIIQQTFSSVPGPGSIGLVIAGFCSIPGRCRRR